MIPGIVIAILTFPGVIVHEAAHMLFCRLRRVAIFDACFFRFGNPVGYVVHENAKDFTTMFLIAVGPFIVNSLLCMVICLPVIAPTQLFGRFDPLSYVLLWIGLSIGMHAFPSTQDARVLWSAARTGAKRGSPLAIVSFPLVVAIYIANILSFFWFDYIYGYAIGLGLPKYILEHIS